MTKPNKKAIQEAEILESVKAAFRAAELATGKYLAVCDTVYPCGFAWVMIKPARGPLVSALKKNKIGSSGIYGGYMIHNPSRNPTQCMEAKIEGAMAFVKVIKEAGFATHDTIFIQSRID